MFDLNNLPDPATLSREELRELFTQLESLYGEVEAQEPDEDSEEYESWLEDLEEIEDLMDEIGEMLEP